MKSSSTPNIKLIQSLELLSQTEMQSFTEFASSKYFSGDRNYLKTLNCLQKHHTKGFQGISNAELFNMLSRELGVSSRTLLNRLSELYLIFEKFLIIESLQGDSSEKNKILLSVLYRKKSLKLFGYVAKRTRKIYEKKGIDLKTINDLLEIRQLESLAAFEKKDYAGFQKIHSVHSLYLTAHYLISLFVESAEHLQQIVLGKSGGKSNSQILLENLGIEELLKCIRQESDLLYKYVMIHYCTYRSLLDYSEVSYFNMARKLHSAIKNELTHDENQEIYFLFITYSINQLGMGRSEFYMILFEIIDEKLKAGYCKELSDDNYPVNNFRDYVIIALRVGQIEWVKDFVKKYSHMLPVSYRENEKSISLARIAQFERRFEDSLKYVEKIKKTNYLYYMDFLALSIRAYFEMGMTDEAYEKVERLKQYINYHKEIPNPMKKDYTEYTKDFVLLMKYSEGLLSKSDLKFKLRNRDMSKVRLWIADRFKEILHKK